MLDTSRVKASPWCARWGHSLRLGSPKNIFWPLRLGDQSFGTTTSTELSRIFQWTLGHLMKLLNFDDTSNEWIAWLKKNTCSLQYFWWSLYPNSLLQCVALTGSFMFFPSFSKEDKPSNCVSETRSFRMFTCPSWRLLFFPAPQMSTRNAALTKIKADQLPQPPGGRIVGRPRLISSKF